MIPSDYGDERGPLTEYIRSDSGEDDSSMSESIIISKWAKPLTEKLIKQIEKKIENRVFLDPKSITNHAYDIDLLC